MPNKDNAKKAMRQTAKCMQHNKVIREEIHSLRVKLRKLTDLKKHSEALEIARIVGKKLDKAKAKGIYKLNTVARYKSRFMKKVNALAK